MLQFLACVPDLCKNISVTREQNTHPNCDALLLLFMLFDQLFVDSMHLIEFEFI